MTLGPVFSVTSNLQQKPSKSGPEAVTARFPMPEGKDWEDLLITVISYDKLLFKLGSKKKIFTRKQLGMEKQNGKPKYVWDTLVLMAAAPDNEMTNTYVSSKKEYRERLLDKQGLKTDIKDLRDYLQVITGIDSNPFHRYATSRGYKSRFPLRVDMDNKDY